MRLIQLKLENFRQHRDTTIDFANGMTAIVGANGSGKSTLLEGITYALYGEQRNTKETIRFYWDDKKKYLATVEFELDGSRYSVERSNSDAKLCSHTPEGLVPIATGLTSTSKACEKLLGLTYDQFINSFCAEQKQLGFLNFKNAAARQEEVARMLGFDRLKEAELIAKDRRSHFRTKADVLEQSLGKLSDLEFAKSATEAKLKEIEKELAALEKQEKALVKKMEPALELKTKADKWRSFSNEMSKLGGEASGLKDAVKLAMERLEEAQKHVAELRILEPKEEEFRRLETENKEWLRRKDEDRQREIIEVQAKSLRCEVIDIDEQMRDFKLPDLPALEKEFIGATEKLSRSESHFQELREAWSKSLAASQEELAAAKARADEAKRALDHCEAMVAKGVCPECGQALAEGFSPVLKRAKEEYAKRTTELEKASKASEKAQAKSAALSKAEKELSAAKTDLEGARKVRDAAALAHEQVRGLQKIRATKAEQAVILEATLANTPAVYIAEKHAAISKQMEKLDKEHLRFLALQGVEKTIEARTKDHAKATANYQSAKDRYKALENERKELGFASNEKADEALAAFSSLEREMNDVQANLRSHNSVLTYARASVDQATQALESYRAKAKELAEARQGAANHEIVAREMRTLREKLNQSIRPDLSFRASENLNLLTNGRYSMVELNENFEPLVIEEGVSKPVISGGEEDVVALALRLALSELIQERNGRPMSLLILDEVFGSLDVERRQSVLDRLASLKGRFNQILVISHVEEINQVADQAIYLSRNVETRATTVTDAPPDIAALLV